MGTLIELIDVTAGYRFEPVFEHVTLEIGAGAFVGVVGPTGAGKTTLLRTVIGTLSPAAGTVLVGGVRVRNGSPAAVGYVPQRGAVDTYFPVTVEQVILMGAARARRLAPWPSRTERQRAAALADRLGIGECLRHHIRDVSGGQQQRTFLARALIHEPNLLVLDEPTANVDIRTQHDILHHLTELNRDGLTIVMTTHDLNAVAVHLPEVVCFNRGVVARGAPRVVFSDEVLRATFGEQVSVVRHEGHLVVTSAGPPPTGKNGRGTGA